MTKAVEIAQKQRYLHLLGKIKANQTLTAAEIKELEVFEMASRKSPEGDENVIRSQKEAAAYCKVSVRTIRNWEKEHTLKDAAGNYLTDRLDARIAERDAEKNPLRTRLLTAQATRQEVNAQLAEIQLKIKQGELVPREDIDTQRLERILETRRVLLSLIRKLPPRLKDKNLKDMQEIVKEEIYHTLKVFSGDVDKAEDLIEDVKFLWDRLSPVQKKKIRDFVSGRKRKKH